MVATESTVILLLTNPDREAEELLAAIEVVGRSEEIVGEDPFSK